MKIKVLCFVGFYLPGYKAGGPLRTIANMVAHLSESVDFWIVTRDRDLGDSTAYSGIKADQWQEVGGAHVYYLSPDKCSLSQIRKVMVGVSYDVLYLNSFYDPVFTIKPLLIRRYLKGDSKRCIVAPRGEFSEGAIALKATKKKIYNYFSSVLGLCEDVVFQASSEHEARDIIHILGVAPHRVEVAIDLAESNTSVCESIGALGVRSLSSFLRVIFLSRISPMKNLDFAINALSLVTQKVQFDIYGPAEDLAYWRHCQLLIEALPPNISVSYHGSVLPAEVKKTFAQYDLFFFPSRGENYGHVIAESLSAGTPVLLSDQTPWIDLEPQGLGWDLPLASPELFAKKIDEFAVMEPNLRDGQRPIIQSRAAKLLQNPEIIKSNLDLFRARISF